jgi:hypothetical protein
MERTGKSVKLQGVGHIHKIRKKDGGASQNKQLDTILILAMLY